MSTMTVTFNGRKLDITFDYDDGSPGTHWQPPDDATLEITSARFGGTDISDSLTGGEAEELTDMVMARYEQEQDVFQGASEDYVEEWDKRPLLEPRFDVE